MNNIFQFLPKTTSLSKQRKAATPFSLIISALLVLPMSANGAEPDTIEAAQKAVKNLYFAKGEFEFELNRKQLSDPNDRRHMPINIVCGEYQIHGVDKTSNKPYTGVVKILSKGAEQEGQVIVIRTIDGKKEFGVGALMLIGSRQDSVKRFYVRWAGKKPGANPHHESFIHSFQLNCDPENIFVTKSRSTSETWLSLQP